MQHLIWLSEQDVERAFPLDVAVASQRTAFEALGRGEAVLPERLLVHGTGDDVAFCYAARTAPADSAVSKFGAVHSGNAARGLPAVHAVLTVLDSRTGAPSTIMAGTTLTTLRTAAASAVAVESLSSKDHTDLAIIGGGVQAMAHLTAIAHVRRLTRVRLFTRTRVRAERLAEAWAAQAPHGAPRVEVCDKAEDAVRGASVVVTATTSLTPVIADPWVAPDALVVSVGSFSAERSELPQALMARSRVVVDHRATALADAGCVVQGIASGTLDGDAIETLGEVLVAPRATTSATRPTVYVSVGVGVQDAAAAAAVETYARERSIGTVLDL